MWDFMKGFVLTSMAVAATYAASPAIAGQPHPQFDCKGPFQGDCHVEAARFPGTCCWRGVHGWMSLATGTESYLRVQTIGVVLNVNNQVEVGWVKEYPNTYYAPAAIWTYGGLQISQWGTRMGYSSTLRRYWVRWYPADPPQPDRWTFSVADGTLLFFSTPASTWNEGDVATNAEREEVGDTWTESLRFTSLQSLSPNAWSDWGGWKCYLDDDANYSLAPDIPLNSHYVTTTNGSATCP
jgi:hypothetical protein